MPINKINFTIMNFKSIASIKNTVNPCNQLSGDLIAKLQSHVNQINGVHSYFTKTIDELNKLNLPEKPTEFIGISRFMLDFNLAEHLHSFNVRYMNKMISILRKMVTLIDDEFNLKESSLDKFIKLCHYNENNFIYLEANLITVENFVNHYFLINNLTDIFNSGINKLLTTFKSNLIYNGCRFDGDIGRSKKGELMYKIGKVNIKFDNFNLNQSYLKTLSKLVAYFENGDMIIPSTLEKEFTEFGKSGYYGKIDIAMNKIKYITMHQNKKITVGFTNATYKEDFLTMLKNIELTDIEYIIIEN